MIEHSLGGIWEIWLFEVLIYPGTDAETQAAVDAFNFFFGLTFEFGVMAFMYTMVVSLLARS